MAVLPLVTAPDPRLAVPSAEITVFDDNVAALAQDMFDTMYARDGIGLAAVQIGVHKRLLVMDLQEDGQQNQRIIINPVIVASSDETCVYHEGCLSFPNQLADVTRPANVTVEYCDIHGNTQRVECSGLLATCIQHEMDHLNGITFVDHLSRMKREFILRKVKKQKKLS